MEGKALGTDEGSALTLGDSLGNTLGADDGNTLGTDEGSALTLGDSLGNTLGADDGITLGSDDGSVLTLGNMLALGDSDGRLLGLELIEGDMLG